MSRYTEGPVQAAQQRAMFGETVEDMVEAAAHNMGDPVLLNGYAASILSDAQLCFEHSQHEFGRQLINKAKWFIAESTRIQRGVCLHCGHYAKEPDGTPRRCTDRGPAREYCEVTS